MGVTPYRKTFYFFISVLKLLDFYVVFSKSICKLFNKSANVLTVKQLQKTA